MFVTIARSWKTMFELGKCSATDLVFKALSGEKELNIPTIIATDGDHVLSCFLLFLTF